MQATTRVGLPVVRRPSTLTKTLKAIAVYAGYVLMSLFIAAPFIWAVFSSLKSAVEIYVFPPPLFPAVPQWKNYVEIWSFVPLGRFISNTAIVTILATLGGVSSATLVAYGFARLRFPGRTWLFMLVLSTLMLPPQVTLIPSFVLFKLLGWLDSFLPLIVPAYFGGGAFGIFLMRQFFMTIPKDLDEAAKIDGAGHITVLLRVLIPLVTPAISALAVFNFLFHWNDFLQPLIYLSTTEKFTLSLGLRFLQTTGFVHMGVSPITDHYLLAAAVVATIPSLAIFVVAQKQFIEGIALTGLQG